MGQTLTNGIYLPDEGERNCYNGLAANWQLLDGAVGTIAAHTAALAGKAPAVHTHTKADITDFPAYGTTAGTICEGNDSRLSDARTPVAHTHTKSDVTDLLNSNFIPSANNSYDLGSSSYQWNNLYAKNYYYNGVAWGLDKTNTWTGNNSYTGIVSLDSSSDVAEQFKQKLPKDVSVSTDALVRFNTLTDSENHNVVVEALGHWADYVSKSTTLKYKNDSTKQGTIDFRLESNGSGLLYPQSPFECHLGNSGNQWKTLNGINPGALSLPRGYTEEGADKHYINIASIIQTLDGTVYNYTMPDNGWICVRAEQATQVHVTLSTWYFGQSISHPTGSTLIVSVPFRKNDQITLKVNAVTLQYARFYPMQGNV